MFWGFNIHSLVKTRGRIDYDRIAMAHYYDTELRRLDSFNFATDVVDYWASKKPSLQAMYWVSQDGKTQRDLSFTHFSRESHRLAILLREQLKVKEGDRMLMILPRLPVWLVYLDACVLLV